MTPQQPPGATNTTRSVTVDGSDHSSPHKATQGEMIAAGSELMEAIRVNVASKIDEVRQSRLTGDAPADYQIALCAIGAVIALGWTPPNPANPSSLETSP